MSFTVPPGYSKLPSEIRHNILRDGIAHFGLKRVFSDFAKITRLRSNTAWGPVYQADLEMVTRMLPEIDCPPGTFFSRLSNQCIKDTSANRNRAAERQKNTILPPSPTPKLIVAPKNPKPPKAPKVPKVPKVQKVVVIEPSRTDVYQTAEGVEPSTWHLDLQSVMLAQDAPKDFNALQYPIYTSIKYDGHRGVRARGTVLSRGLIPLPNDAIRTCLTTFLPEGFDFELLVHNSLNETASWVRSIKKGLPNRLDIIVFDWVQKDDIVKQTPFHQRYENIQQWASQHAETIEKLKTIGVGSCKNIHIKTKTHVLIKTARELERVAKNAFLEKQEGLVLRSPNGIYVEYRSKDMLKVKDHQDSEGIIIGFNQAADGLLQSFRLRWTLPDSKKVIEFNISSGMNQTDRRIYWQERQSLLGQFLKFSYQGKPNSTIARHAKIIGIRDKADM